MTDFDTEKDLESGLERLSFGAFFRKYHKFRTSDISPRFVPLPEDIELPQGSVVHLLDNMYSRDNKLTMKDTPNLNIPFIKNEKFRKYIYHVMAPDVTDPANPIVLKRDYVYRNMNLNRNLMLFRKEMGSSLRYLTNLESIPASMNTMTIINHNPLFRTFTRGILPVYRQFKVILGSVLNTASKIKDKNQYIIVPLSQQIYPRDKFRMAEKAETTSAIKSQNSFHYFMMMHWLNFISTVSDLSLFESYPEENWTKTNIVFTVGVESFRHAMIWSLHDAQALNTGNKFYPRYVNQINALVLSSMGEEVSDSDETESEIEKLTKDKHLPTETKPEEVVTQAPKEDTQDESESTKVEEESTSNLHNYDSSDEIHQEIVKKFIEEEPESKEEEKKEVAAPVVKSLAVPSNYSSVIGKLTPNLDTFEDIPDLSSQVSEETDVGMNGEVKPIKPFTSPNQISSSGKKYLKTIDKDLDVILEADTRLTSKQKERVRKLHQASKEIKFNGKTVEQILTEPVDPRTHENNLDFLKDQLVDPSMVGSSIQNFDDVYMKNFFEKDLISIGISMNKHGMILKGVEEQVHSDELNRVRKFKFSYEDLSGKSHTVKFDVPHIDDDGSCLVNGIKCMLRKQMANLPICKVSSTRVSLASNYNKTVIERNVAKAHNFLSYFQRIIAKVNSDSSNGSSTAQRIRQEFGSQVISDPVAYEYSALASLFSRLFLTDPKGNLTSLDFAYSDRFRDVPEKEKSTIMKMEEEYGVYFGRTTVNAKKNSPLYLFFHPTNIVTVINPNDLKNIFKTTIIDMVTSMYNVVLSSGLTEWTDIKILDKKFPVGFLLCYQFGLLHMLKYLGVSYQVYEKRKRFEKRYTDIVIPFQDRVLVIPRYPLRNSLIMSGLLMFDTSKYLMEEMEFKDVYFQLLMDKGPGFRTNYLKGIDDTFAFFVDPITHDVLEQMGEPTTFKDLLIRSTDMLVVEAHHEASSMKNHRLRSYERINSIIYNEMSRQYAAHRRKSGGGSSFSLNPNAVMQRILQDQAMMITEDINPIHEIKTNTGFTYSGMGGRTAQSFVINDRRYPDDAMGIISEATPDSGSVAITAIAPADPTIANVRGILNIEDKDDLEPSQLLSTTSLLMPGTTQDDSKRANFVSIQLSHQLPTKEGECFRIRTGYERVIAHRSSSLYSYAARLDGKVLDVDEKIKMCKIQYKDGTIHTFPFGEVYGECADMVTTQKLNLVVKKGEKFSRGDILSYNPQFFEYDPSTKQADWKHGVSAMVAIMDCAGTYEDSNIITHDLGQKLEIEPVEVRSLSISANTLIHSIKKMGDRVDINDPLMVFEDASVPDLDSLSSNEEALEYLAKLNRMTPKAKVTGEIVKIEAFYSIPLQDMHPSLSRVVKEIIRVNTEKNRFSQGTSTSAQYPPSQPLPEGTKFKKVKFEKDTVVIRFFIKETLSAGVGDKIVFDSSLKSVVGMVTNHQPQTESGRKVDAVFSGSSISNRIVNSPILVGLGERVMEALEDTAVDIYFSK